MDLLKDADLVLVIFRLLPGFVSAWVFFGFTAHEKKDTFDRLVQALIFTVLIEFIVVCFSFILLLIGNILSVGEWNENAAFFWRVVFAVLVGIVAAVLANTNWLKDMDKTVFIKRWLPARLTNGFPSWLTKKTTYPSEWYSAFHNAGGCFVILGLTHDRRIHGWVDEFPDSPTSGHFLLTETSWVLNDNTLVPTPTISQMLIPVSQVEHVEFDKKERVSAEELIENRESEKAMIEFRRKQNKQDENGGNHNEQ